MTYDPTLFEIVQTRAAAYIGSFIIGESEIGATTSSTYVLPASSATVNDGVDETYAPEPSTASASFSEWITIDPEDAATLPPYSLNLENLSKGAWTFYYDGVVLFKGTVANIATTVTADNEAVRRGFTSRRSSSLTFQSFDKSLLDTVVGWSSLPEEDWHTRLSRFANVDIANTSFWWLTAGGATPTPAALAEAFGTAPAVPEPGSAALIDILREFTAATDCGIRRSEYLSIPAGSPNLDIFQVTYDLALPEVQIDSQDYLSEVTYDFLQPTAVSIVKNDMRFTSGFDTESGEQLGFIIPQAVSIFGYPAVALRLKQTFSETYSAEFELAVNS